MSTAKVILFPTQQQSVEPPKEVRVADCDDGYTRIANDLLDDILKAGLSQTQLLVVLAIVRKTYGYNKKSDRISDSQIAEAINVHRTHVCNAKNELLARNILFRDGRAIGVNKVISDWKTGVYGISYTVAESATQTVAESATQTVAESATHKRQYKDKRQKEKGASANADTPTASQPENQPELDLTDKSVKTEKPRSKYDDVIDVFHRVLPEMKQVKELTPARKEKIRNFFSKYKFSLHDWEGYLTHISQNCRWMLEARPRNRGPNDESRWKPKTFDFLLTERCYLGVLEGNYDD